MQSTCTLQAEIISINSGRSRKKCLSLNNPNLGWLLPWWARFKTSIHSFIAPFFCWNIAFSAFFLVPILSRDHFFHFLFGFFIFRGHEVCSTQTLFCLGPFPRGLRGDCCGVEAAIGIGATVRGSVWCLKGLGLHGQGGLQVWCWCWYWHMCWCWF